MAGEPQRRCVACRKSSDRSELLRIVVCDGNLRLDVEGRSPGRGAYIHRRSSCWRNASDKGRWEHALRIPKNSLAAAGFAEFLQSLAPYVLGEVDGEASGKIGRKIRL
ncbi:MAG: YlxR family protein [Deltaproteobacteria bacterium]|nr:YlxR family protein [Deltaproteobacteria bacterium]